MPIIYSLLCPRCGCPRYVGQTIFSAQHRLREHLKGLRAADNSVYKKYWVQALLDQGLVPRLRVLSELLTPEDLDASEIFWIKELRGRGCPLTNLTDGGGGNRGYKQSVATIEKRMIHIRGVPKSQATKDKISAALTGRPSPLKGLPNSPARAAGHARGHAIPPFQDQHGRVYKTIKECAERWSLAPGNICNVLKGKRKSTGGLVFTYL